MNELTTDEKLELVGKISKLMDDFFEQKQCTPADDVLLLTLQARTPPWVRKDLFVAGITAL